MCACVGCSRVSGCDGSLGDGSGSIRTHPDRQRSEPRPRDAGADPHHRAREPDRPIQARPAGSRARGVGVPFAGYGREWRRRASGSDRRPHRVWNLARRPSHRHGDPGEGSSPGGTDRVELGAVPGADFNLPAAPRGALPKHQLLPYMDVYNPRFYSSRCPPQTSAFQRNHSPTVGKPWFTPRSLPFYRWLQGR